MFTLRRTGWIAATLLLLVVGCKKPADDLTPATQGCQLKVEQNIFGQTTSHAYNAQGQRIKSVSSSNGTPIVYTYAYDATGNIIAATTQGVLASNRKIDVIGSYEYTGGRLTKIVSKSLGDILFSTSDTYSYDASGRLAAYTYASSDTQGEIESYTFTNGLVTAGAITRGGQSWTLTAENGRITQSASANGSRTRHTYDARGYLTRSDSFNQSGALQSYTVREYSNTPYKEDRPLRNIVPPINLYGNTELPESRVAVYQADGTLTAETRTQYQINSQGYITTISYTKNQVGVGNGQSTQIATYDYSNCP